MIGRLIDHIIERTASDLRADDIADCCRDACSFDAFGPLEWRAAARMMARKGYTEREIDAILRSRWTRWLRDAAGRYNGTAKDLAAYIDRRTPTELARVVRGTEEDQ